MKAALILASSSVFVFGTFVPCVLEDISSG